MFARLFCVILALCSALFASCHPTDHPCNKNNSTCSPSNPSMKKTITPFVAQLVTFETSLPYTEVIAKLDVAVNKSGSAGFLQSFRSMSTKQDIENLIHGITGNNSFLYFLEMNHDRWMNIYEGVTTNPKCTVYTIGNPIIAQTVMQYDIRAGYNIPPRLMILEKADHSGTSLIYHLPSSVMALTPDPRLRAAAVDLDNKFEQMIKGILQDEPATQDSVSVKSITFTVGTGG